MSDFHYLLESLFDSFTELSMTTTDGKCLKVKTDNLGNSQGLMQSALLLKNFFPITDDSIFFHNEATLGCTQFGSVQFVFSEAGFLFSCNQKFEIPWCNEKNCFQNFIKIPPFPLMEKGKLNEFIFESFKTNSQLPSHFTEDLRTIVKSIQRFKDKVRQTVRLNPHFFTKEVLQNYLEECKEEAHTKIKQRVFSQAQVEIPFLGQHLLKMKVISDELGLKIDFQGTSPEKSNAQENFGISLPELLTDSVCFQMLSQYFQFSHKMNSSTFSLFQIIKPQNSFVGSKNTQHLISAEHWGIPLLQTGLHQALWKMYGKNQTAPHNYFPLNVQLKTHDDKFIKIHIPNGRAFYLNNNYNQDKGYFTKNNSDGSLLPNLEAFEQLGIQVLSISERTSKFQKGTHPTGPGWTLTLKTTKVLKVLNFPDIVLAGSKNDKILSNYESSQIELDGKTLNENNFCFEVPANSVFQLSSGYSPAIM